MANGFLCYFHHNDAGSQAVATCSKCGKHLCAECAKTFKIDNGSLCPECQKVAIRQAERNNEQAKKTVYRELIFMAVGFIIGLIIRFTNDFGQSVGLSSGFITAFSFWIPFACASFVSIIKMSFRGRASIFLKIGKLIGYFLISPGILVYRIVVRVRHLKELQESKAKLASAERACDAYIEVAEKKTGANYYFKFKEASEQALRAQQEADQRVGQVQQAYARKQAEVDSLNAQLRNATSKEEKEYLTRRLYQEQSRADDLQRQRDNAVRVAQEATQEKEAASLKFQHATEDLQKQYEANLQQNKKDLGEEFDKKLEERLEAFARQQEAERAADRAEQAKRDAEQDARYAADRAENMANMQDLLARSNETANAIKKG